MDGIFIGFVILAVAIIVYMVNESRKTAALRKTLDAQFAIQMAAWAVDPMNPENPNGYLYVGSPNFDQAKYNAYMDPQNPLGPNYITPNSL